MKTCGSVILSALFFSVLFGCGGGMDYRTSFRAPVDLAILSGDYFFKGKNRRMLFVAGSKSGMLTAVDPDDMKVLDLHDFDKRMTGIPVGGTPVAMVAKSISSGDAVDRVFAADGENNRVIVIDLESGTADDDDVFHYSYVDGGGGEVNIATIPVFEDRGRYSTPRYGDVSVLSFAGTVEHWYLEYRGDDYEVKSSVSGKQKGKLKEGETYTTDDGSVSLTIYQGADKTNKGDSFTFSVFKTKPIDLGFTPVALMLIDNDLVAVDGDSGRLVFYDSSSLAQKSTVVLAGPSGGSVKPVFALYFDGSIYVLDLGADFVRYKVADGTQEVVNLSAAASYAFSSSATGKLYLLVTDERKMVEFDPDSGTLTGRSIEFPSAPDCGAYGSYGSDRMAGNGAAVVTREHGVYLVNLDDMERVDLSGDGVRESSATSPNFQDMGENSSPKMTSVTTYDGVTRTQVWTIVFEGVVPGAVSESGVLNGGTFTDSTIDFTSLKVGSDDKVVISSEDLEVGIKEVVDAHTLKLDSDTGKTLSSVSYEIRGDGCYVVRGSLSGVQAGRAKAGESYTSDDGEVSFSILANISSPVTRDDLFTFRTYDGVNSIRTYGSVASRCIAVNDPSRARDLLWVSFVGSQNLSVIDIKDRRERKLLY